MAIQEQWQYKSSGNTREHTEAMAIQSECTHSLDQIIAFTDLDKHGGAAPRLRFSLARDPHAVDARGERLGRPQVRRHDEADVEPLARVPDSFLSRRMRRALRLLLAKTRVAPSDAGFGPNILTKTRVARSDAGFERIRNTCTHTHLITFSYTFCHTDHLLFRSAKTFTCS